MDTQKPQKNIAGMSLKGGRKDQFYFCLLEYFNDQDRWFLKSLLRVKDQENQKNISGDDIIKSWIEDYNLKELVVDVPLTYPAYHQQNSENIQEEEVQLNTVQDLIQDLLLEDERRILEDPKKYEHSRINDNLIDFSKNVLKIETYDHILSKSFKRRLKKGFLPYWNRTLDFWVWYYYYDQLLDLFNISFDSFGNVSLMNIFRFDYLKINFPNSLQLYESDFYITLIELLRASVISKNNIEALYDIEENVEARLDVIKQIELTQKIFIYDEELEILCKNPRAFESFILALSGQCIQLGKIRTLPDWTMPKSTMFVVPFF
jgi:hypothetical protein